MDGIGVSAETPALATVAQQGPGSAPPAEQLRRVHLIERQRDQNESEAVSHARG